MRSNSVDPDQTAPFRLEQSGQGLQCLPFHLHYLEHYSMVNPHGSIFIIITAIFSGVGIFKRLTVLPVVAASSRANVCRGYIYWQLRKAI